MKFLKFSNYKLTIIFNILTQNVLILFILLSTFHITFSQQSLNLRKPLNPENYKIWDEYIRKFAPADSAYNVVIHIARQHYITRRPIVALEVFNIYEKLFPNKIEDIQNEKNFLIQQSLTIPPIDDHRLMYHNLIIHLRNTTDGIVAVKRMFQKYVEQSKFDSALIVINNYKRIFPDYQDFFNELIEILTRDELPVTINHLPKPLNSQFDEWDPNPLPFQNKLYLSGRLPKSNGGIDIFETNFENGEWKQPIPLPKNINGKDDETIDNITIDGHYLLLSGEFAESFGKFDIYALQKSDTGWSQLLHFPIPINSGHQDESGYLTSDNKALIFTSDRPNGINQFVPYGQVYNGSLNGNMDIYVSLLIDGNWSEPTNFGPTINTPFSERSAYLHPDGKTLYFSSEGHPGLGGLDVFKSIRLSDTSWTQWSKPINLGRFINTTGDDWGYKIGISGDSAFFSSRDRNDSYGGFDIYSVNIPKQYQPNNLAIIKGNITDLDNNPIYCQINWENLETGESLGTLYSDPNSGNYLIALPLGKNYGYYANKDNYYPTSGNINLKNIDYDTTISQNIKLISIENINSDKQSLTINNIFFDYDKYDLKSESFFELDRFINFYKNFPNKTIIVIGHTDNSGTANYNLELSKNRANSVKNYLIMKGISVKNIKIESFGDTKPIVPNNSEENRAKNRRVEINIE
jgi:outer membrane protein OmpA-like peptidoglycan-associated protein